MVQILYFQLSVLAGFDWQKGQGSQKTYEGSFTLKTKMLSIREDKKTLNNRLMGIQ